MRKLFVVLCAALAIVLGGSAKSNAQCAFPDGTVGINLGLGLGHSTWNHPGYNHYWDDVFVPSFNFALDYGFLPNIINSNGCISGGGYFSFGHGSQKFNGDNKDLCTQWRIGTRGALHYTWVRNLDTYAGVALGAKGESNKWKHADGHKEGPWKSTDFDIYGFGGVRYIMGNFAVYSELATTNFAWFQVGISFVL